MQYHASDKAPKAIGPYSQAVSRGQMIFTSGQIALDPASGKIVEGDFETKTRRVFDNLRAVLEAAGSSFSDVVRATVYLTDLSDFPKLNAIYEEYMGSHRPSRSTVGVAALPMGSPVEIDMIAMLSERRATQ